MGKRHGSKEAYEASRAGAREYQRRYYMTEAERAAERLQECKRRNLDRLTGDEAMMTYSLFLGAAMAGGLKAGAAAKEADAAIEALKSRFT